jgi:hypothetical protein
MNGNPYTVLGIGVAELKGRVKDYQTLCRRIETDLNNNISVIGAKYMGKTVLLNALKNHFSDESEKFAVCIYWNLSHYTPANDEEFYSQFGKHLSAPLGTINEEFKEYFSETPIYDEIRGAFEFCKDKGIKILVFMDSLDKLLSYGNLTRNVWDNLLTLVNLSSLSIVTGSRKKLRDIVGGESANSQFWGIFSHPHLLNPFDENDWENLLKPFSNCAVQFDSDAKNELARCTGGSPIISSEICRQIWEDSTDNSTVSKAGITKAADDFSFEACEWFGEIWNDCENEQKETLALVANGRLQKYDEIQPNLLPDLHRKGFIYKQGEDVKLFQLVEKYIRIYQSNITELNRLFGKEDDFKKNIKSILELRLAQIQNCDETLYKKVKYAVEKLHWNPEESLKDIRDIAKRAFDLIWDKQFAGRNIPVSFTDDWRRMDGMNYPPQGTIHDNAYQCRVLDYLTDPNKSGATNISRMTYSKLNFLFECGNFATHIRDYSYAINDEFAYTVCLTAVEMCEQLTKDLA